MPDLGKYADAVLSAWGASLVLLALLVLFTLRRGRKARAALAEAERGEDKNG